MDSEVQSAVYEEGESEVRAENLEGGEGARGGVAYISAAVGGEDAWFQVQVRHKKMTFGVRVHTC